MLLQLHDYLEETNAKVHLINCNDEIKAILLYVLPKNLFLIE